MSLHHLIMMEEKLKHLEVDLEVYKDIISDLLFSARVMKHDLDSTRRERDGFKVKLQQEGYLAYVPDHGTATCSVVVRRQDD